MATIKEILLSDKLAAMEDFSIKETDKILARVQELSEKFETLDKHDTQAQLDVVVESQQLTAIRRRHFNTIHFRRCNCSWIDNICYHQTCMEKASQKLGGAYIGFSFLYF